MKNMKKALLLMLVLVMLGVMSSCGLLTTASVLYQSNTDLFGASAGNTSGSGQELSGESYLEIYKNIINEKNAGSSGTQNKLADACVENFANWFGNVFGEKWGDYYRVSFRDFYRGPYGINYVDWSSWLD